MVNNLLGDPSLPGFSLSIPLLWGEFVLILRVGSCPNSTFSSICVLPAAELKVCFCLFEDCVGNWPALKNWSPEYLRNKVGSKTVGVQITPNGRADAVTATGMLLHISMIQDYVEK